MKLDVPRLSPGQLVWNVCKSVLWARPQLSDKDPFDTDVVAYLNPGDALIVLEVRPDHSTEVRVLGPRSSLGWVTTDILVIESDGY